MSLRPPRPAEHAPPFYPKDKGLTQVPLKTSHARVFCVNERSAVTAYIPRVSGMQPALLWQPAGEKFSDELALINPNRLAASLP